MREIVVRVLSVVLIVLCLTSCANVDSDLTIDGESVGVIWTKTSSYDSIIKVYDMEGSHIRDKEYRMASVGRFGFGIPQSRDGVVYEIANGNDSKKNAGLVVGYNVYTNEINEIDFGRDNLIDLFVTDEYLFVLSNQNNKTFIDWYDFASKTIDTFVLNDDMLTDFTVSNENIVYFITSNNALYKLDIQDKSTKKICFSSEAAYMFAYDGNIYISKTYETDEMTVINEMSGASHSIGLGIAPVGQPYYNDGYLYVSNEDPVWPGERGSIVKIRLSDENIVAKWKFDHNIYQFSVYKDIILTLDWNEDKLRIYYLQNESDSPVLKKEIDVSQNDNEYKLSSLFFTKSPN